MRLLHHRSDDRLHKIRPPEKQQAKPKEKLPQLRLKATAVPRKPLVKPQVPQPVGLMNLPPVRQQGKQRARPRVRLPLLLLTATAASSSPSVEYGDGRRHMTTR